MNSHFPLYQCARRVLLITSLLSSPAFLQSVQAQDNGWLLKDKPSWVWAQESSANQKLYLRKGFEIPSAVMKARVYATCDNQLRLFLNGKEVGTSPDWPYPIEKDVSDLLSQGKNVVAARGCERDGDGGFCFEIGSGTGQWGEVGGKER